MTAAWRRPAIVAGLIAIVLIATQVDPHRVPLGTVLYGALYGSLNGLLAIGLVLIYRVSRVINFAYGAMGGLGAAVGVGLYSSDHWPWGAAIVVGVVVGALIGAVVSALIEWRFARAPRLVVTVVTIGLAQLIGGFAAYIPKWTGTPTRVALAGFQTGLSSISTFIKPVLFTGNELLILIVVPLTVAGVAWFLLRTDAGRAVRAIADNGERARLLGIPARRLMIGVWALSGVVAALAVLLAAPDQGVTITATAGPTLLLAPLAAAVVAKMERLWVAFAAAVALGVVQYLTGLNVSKQDVSTVVLLVVVVLALLFQHRSGSRAEAADESSWSATGTITAIPQALRDWRPLRFARVGAVLVLGALALALPALLPASRLDQISGAIVFALAALSLVILSGWGGTISLGQFALVGVGAITAGDLMQHANIDLFLALGAGGVAAALAAVVLGLPALRVKGLFLAVTTLAFAVAADDFFFNGANFPNQLPSAVLRPVLWKRFNLTGEGDLYLLCLGVLVLTIILTYGLRRSRTGRAVLATRDNLRGAEAAAVPTTKVRLMAFAISGLIAGIAGGLYVIIYSTAAGNGTGSSFPSSASLLVFSMAVIGGLTSIGGALTAVAILEVIGIAFPNLQLLLSGVGLLVVLVAFPSGLSGLGSTVRNYVLSVVARRRGLDASVWGDTELETLDDRAPVVVESADERPVLLRCSDVNASYGSLQVLFGVDLTVHQGEILALLGTNGAGKSSLLKSITGLLPAHQGSITFAGSHITSESTERIAARGLTMMPGGRGTFASLTVAENLRVASWALRRDRTAAATQRQRALELFPRLNQRSHIAAGNLSGGEQQMLSLAMAFLNEPQLLCIDELSLGLAPTVVADLIEAVKAIHQRGTTIVIVEQSVNVALLIAERAVFLEKGQVRFSGPSSDLLGRPDLLRAVFIGGHDQAEPTPARVPHESAANTDEDDSPILVAQGLIKRYGGITAVNDVDLVIRPHEIVGLIGHNGAGKTTLFDVISGFVRADEGSIHLDGIDVTTAPAYWRSIGGLGRSFQEARLFPTLSVAETIAVSLERHLANRDPFAAAFRLPACTDSEARATIRVNEIIDLLGLEGYRDRPTGALSTGTRRIVELACILAHKPSLLMLDEPTAGVAQAETEALGPLLRRVALETGCAMVVIEHDMAMISSLCDRLIALELGAIIAKGTPDDVLSSDAVIASYLGTEPTAVMRSGPVAATT
ncbi:MAG TPA: ATP-binding cassette domain-containing protein [Acidimicrobiales bacterium]|jgi:ABC-type branched-subunit amino acid transport system ATPase component/ABC-type branched-subunit amino acid transport system permease subunit